MRIFGSNAAAQVASPPAPRRAAGGGFAVGEDAFAKPVSAPASLRTIGGIDALLTLQGTDDPAERRRRALKRGDSALDALDELRLALLAGEPTPATLSQLKSATAELSDSSGDSRLDAILGEIELRLEVEIAKLTTR